MTSRDGVGWRVLSALLGLVLLVVAQPSVAAALPICSAYAYDAAPNNSTVTSGTDVAFVAVHPHSSRHTGASPGEVWAAPSIFVAAEGVLPKLTGSIAESFEGGAYTTQTFMAGTTFYRAEGEGQGLGSFLGTVKPASAADAEKMYNLAKWDNPAQVVSTYRLTSDTTMYVGDVAGGSGVQALVPRGIDPASILQNLGTEPLP